MPITIRDLSIADFEQGFFETLESLTDVGLYGNPQAAERIHQARLASGVHTYVAIRAGSVVGTISLVPDLKFIHAGGLVYHLEDVAVHRDHQGRHIGSALVQHAVTRAAELGAYKVVLNCYDHLVSFYQQFGFHVHDLCLRLDL